MKIASVRQGTAALTLAVIAPALYAQTEEIQVTGQQLEESIPLDLERFGNRVEVITAADIDLGGFNDLAQTLQMKAPGLYLAPKNGAFDYMNCSLQGSRCQDILWLIDGVRINNRLYNTTSPLDTVPAHMIERIEILYGGQGIFYGTQSVAGVVNIVTKPFSETPSGGVSVGMDSNEGLHASADYRTTFDKHQIVGYVSKDRADGFQPFRDQDYQPSGTDHERGYDLLTAGIKYGYTLSGDSELSFHYQHTEADKLDWVYPSNQAEAYNQRDEDLLTAKWDYAIGESTDLFVKAYYHWWDSYWSETDNDLDVNGTLTGTRSVVSDREFWGYKDYGLTAMARFSGTGKLEYAVGYDHQRFSGRDDVLLIADKTESVNALFAQVRTSEQWLPRTQAALGLRYNQPSGEGDIAVGNLSARHELNDRLYVRGGLGTSFRLPDAFQLYGVDPCCEVGNPNLRGEKSRNFDVALGGTAEGLTWEITRFAREIDDLITTDANDMFVNSSDSVDFDGWDLTASVSLSSQIAARVGYTRTSAHAQGASEQIQDVPKELFKAGLSYRPQGGSLELDISLLNVGEVFDNVSGGIGRLEHGHYTVVDVGAGYRLGNNGRQWIRVRLENIFDERYASSIGRAFMDVDGSSYPYWNLGTPRTIHVSYGHSF